MGKTEIWKDIPEYEGIYQVSNLGRVRSVDRFSRHGHRLRGKLLSRLNVGKGYVAVGLNKDGTRRQFYVHRLVAFAFVSGYEDGFEVNHINEDKEDNRASNLEWVNHITNINHGTGRKRQFEKLYTKKKVEMYSIDGEFISSFESACQAGRSISVRVSHIAECCRGICKTAYGYKWKYKE